MDRKKLEKWIAGRKVAFLGSVDPEGYPNIKAVLPPIKKEGLRTFYFSTNTSSKRVAEWRSNPHATLYFYSKGIIHYQGLLLTGEMEVLEDETIKKEMWRRGDSLYYRKGVTDPDYCILRFTAHTARLYRDLKTISFAVEE